MTTPREKYNRRRETLNDREEAGEVGSDAYDDSNVMVPTPADEGSRTPGTLKSWLYRLMAFAQERDLTDATADELNRDVQAMHDGEHPAVKDGGIKKTTLRSYQAALRKFYGFHEFGVAPGEIPLFDKSESPVDPNDMLTKEEIHEAREAASNPRDRLIFDLLLYTGQRREALRTLRIKDVNPQDGTYRLNPDVDGLKGAQDRNGSRPLLGAKAAVQDWLDYHPDPSEPEHYFITARPGYSAVDPAEAVSGETIRKVMANVKEDTDIDKPMHPHALRHNFVTIAKRDYDLPDDTIKYLIGHHAASNVMETTYSHLSGDDHIQGAEEAWGIREPENESPLTPEVCDICGEPLGPQDKACSRCGAVYTPDARDTKRTIEEDVQGDKENVETVEEYGERDKLERLVRENPELVDVLEDLADE
jgi:integrase/recombinase XerD